MLTKIARIISNVFIPPTNFIAIIILFSVVYQPTRESAISVIIIALICGTLFPLALFFLFLKLKKIGDVDAKVKEERTLPYLLTIGSMAVGSVVLTKYSVRPEVFWFFVSFLLNLVILLIINKFWKISAHAMGVASPLAGLFYLLGLSALPFFIIIPLIAWSRIHLKCHTPAQIFWGTVVGFSSTYFQLQFLVK